MVLGIGAVRAKGNHLCNGKGMFAIVSNDNLYLSVL